MATGSYTHITGPLGPWRGQRGKTQKRSCPHDVPLGWGKVTVMERLVGGDSNLSCPMGDH